MIAAFALVVGFGEHGPGGPGNRWTVFLFGSWTVVYLALASLGAVVIANTLLPLMRLESEAITVDTGRFWDYPRWYQVGQATKLLCGLVVVSFCGILLLSTIAFVLESVLSVPESLVGLRRLWLSLSMIALLWSAAGLVLTVFVHLLCRAIRLGSETF